MAFFLSLRGSRASLPDPPRARGRPRPTRGTARTRRGSEASLTQPRCCSCARTARPPVQVSNGGGIAGTARSTCLLCRQLGALDVYTWEFFGGLSRGVNLRRVILRPPTGTSGWPHRIGTDRNGSEQIGSDRKLSLGESGRDVAPNARTETGALLS